MPYNFETEVVPGKRRNSFLDQQAKQIADAANQNAQAIIAAQQSVVSVIVDYSVSVLDWWIIVDATVSNLTIWLPLSRNGLHNVGVKKVDATANTVTVASTSGDLVDGAATKVIVTQYEAYKFVPDGLGNWWIF